MKHIIFVTKTKGIGGTEVHLVELLKRIDSTKFQVSILCLDNRIYPQLLTDRGIKNIKLVFYNESINILSLIHLLKIMHPDILVFVKGRFDLYPFWMYIPCLFMGKSKVYNIEHAFQFDISIFEKIKNSNGIVYFYKMTFGWLGRRRINGWIQSLVTKNSICVAGFIRNNLIKYFNFSYKNTVTIYNGVDLKESNLNQAPGAICVKNNYKENNEKVLICVSRLSPEKGIEFLIDTMSILKETSVCFKLIIVGDGPLRDKLENMVAIKELSHYVQFIGFQNSVIPYLLKSDLFLLTSYHEGLPFSLLEAMACGLPCIVTDVGGNREVIVNNKNGYLIAPGDKFNLVNKIRYLLLNDEIRTTFSKNNIERIKKLFDINKNMRKVIDVICEN